MTEQTITLVMENEPRWRANAIAALTNTADVGDGVG
jgi:hypothetical protein